MYASPTDWLEETVTCRGTIAQRPVIVPEACDSIQVAGENSNNDPVNLVAYLDAPLPTESTYERRGPVVSRGQNVIVFGVLGKARRFVDESGYVRCLPTMDLLILYTAEDTDHTSPLWLRSLRRSRPGDAHRPEIANTSVICLAAMVFSFPSNTQIQPELNAGLPLRALRILNRARSTRIRNENSIAVGIFPLMRT